LSGRARLALGALDMDSAVHLADAARIFQSLGAAPWRRRAVVELRRRGLKIPATAPRTGPRSPKPRYRSLGWSSRGYSNREIAATVFLSVKTVEGYLSQIYAKTGHGNRLGLTRALDAGSLTLD
jgi:DNA-binding NarL/FixJ family response regulator